MGTYRSDYIIYGYKLPIDLKGKDGNKIDLWDDEFLPYVEGHQGVEFAIISQLEDDENFAFGQKLGYADDYEAWNFHLIDFKSLDNEKVKKEYRKVFGVEENVPIGEPYLFLISNFN